MMIQNRTINVALTCTKAKKQKSTQNFNITNSIEVTMVTYHQLQLHFDVIGEFYVRIFSGLELVLIGVARRGTGPVGPSLNRNAINEIKM